MFGQFKRRGRIIPKYMRYASKFSEWALVYLVLWSYFSNSFCYGQNQSGAWYLAGLQDASRGVHLVIYTGEGERKLHSGSERWEETECHLVQTLFQSCAWEQNLCLLLPLRNSSAVIVVIMPRSLQAPYMHYLMCSHIRTWKGRLIIILILQIRKRRRREINYIA